MDGTKSVMGSCRDTTIKRYVMFVWKCGVFRVPGDSM